MSNFVHQLLPLQCRVKQKLLTSAQKSITSLSFASASIIAKHETTGERAKECILNMSVSWEYITHAASISTLQRGSPRAICIMNIK